MELTPTEALPPYREIFSELERTPISTIDAYTRYYEWLDERNIDPSIYLSTAITSGGLTRDQNLTFPEIMSGHTEFGDLVGEAVGAQYGQGGLLTREDIVVPSDLGKVPGWGQADYLLFWGHVITGLDPREAAVLDDAMQRSGVMERPGFRNKTLPREEKWQDYAALVETYVESLQRLELGKGNDGMELPRNMQAVVLILDSAESLGVNAERYLCHLLGLGEWVCELNKDRIPARTVEMMGRLSALSAEVLPYGEGNVWGKVNQATYWQQRNRGVRNIDRKSPDVIANTGMVISALNAAMRATDASIGPEIATIKNDPEFPGGYAYPTGITFFRPDELATYPDQLQDMRQIGPDRAKAVHELAVAATGRMIFE